MSQVAIPYQQTAAVPYESTFKAPCALYMHTIMSIFEFVPLPQRCAFAAVSRDWQQAIRSSSLGDVWRRVNQLDASLMAQIAAAIASVHPLRKANDPTIRKRLEQTWQEQLKHDGCDKVGQPLLALLRSVAITHKEDKPHSFGHVTLSVQPPSSAGIYAHMFAISPSKASLALAPPRDVATEFDSAPSTPTSPVQWTVTWDVQHDEEWAMRNWKLTQEGASTKQQAVASQQEQQQQQQPVPALPTPETSVTLASLWKPDYPMEEVATEHQLTPLLLQLRSWGVLPHSSACSREQHVALLCLAIRALDALAFDGGSTDVLAPRAASFYRGMPLLRLCEATISKLDG